LIADGPEQTGSFDQIRVYAHFALVTETHDATGDHRAFKKGLRQRWTQLVNRGSCLSAAAGASAPFRLWKCWEATGVVQRDRDYSRSSDRPRNAAEPPRHMFRIHPRDNCVIVFCDESMSRFRQIGGYVQGRLPAQETLAETRTSACVLHGQPTPEGSEEGTRIATRNRLCQRDPAEMGIEQTGGVFTEQGDPPTGLLEFRWLKSAPLAPWQVMILLDEVADPKSLAAGYRTLVHHVATSSMPKT